MRNVFRQICTKNRNTHFVSKNIRPTIAKLRDNVEKCGGMRQVKDDNIIQRTHLRNPQLRLQKHTQNNNISCFFNEKIIAKKRFNVPFTRTLLVLLRFFRNIILSLVNKQIIQFRNCLFLLSHYSHIPVWRCGPTPAMASSFLRFLDHTHRRNTFGRIPPDE